MQTLKIKGVFIALFIAAILFITAFLHNDDLSISNMEARNYVTAREILENGSWLIPTMNGEVRIAKPPLPTWITTLAMRWAGTDSNLSVNRIPSGVCVLFLAFFTVLIARRTSGGGALAVTAVLVLATSPLFLESARKNTWDIYAQTAMAGAIWALIEAFARRQGKAPYLALASLLMTVSFYSKGPVAFWTMLLPFLLGWCLAYGTKDFRENRWGLFWCFASCLALSAAWPLHLYLSIPHEAVAVASRESSGWFSRHTDHIWYYLINLHWIGGIWLLFMLYGLIGPLVDRDWKPGEKMYVFWLVLAILLLTVIPEKKDRYLLPAVVPGAVVASLALERLKNSSGMVGKILYGVFCGVTGMALFTAAGLLAYHAAGRMFFLSGAVLSACTGCVLVASYLAGKREWIPLAAVVGMCLALVFVEPLKVASSPKGPYRQFLHIREYPGFANRPVYYLGNDPVDIEIVWAAGKKVRQVSMGQVRGLAASGPESILIARRYTGLMYPGMRQVDRIMVKRDSYRIYLVH